MSTRVLLKNVKKIVTSVILLTLISLPIFFSPFFSKMVKKNPAC